MTLVHACPVGDAAYTPCCGKTPFELPRQDRITLDDSQVTCQGGVRVSHIFLRIEAPGISPVEAEIGQVITSTTGASTKMPSGPGTVFEAAQADRSGEGRQFSTLLAGLLRAAADEFEGGPTE